MAITETIRDIVNYPSKTKSITLDMSKLVPVNNEGDEVYVLSAAPGTGTTASGSTVIAPIYIREFKAGFSRSSGKKNAPFSITSSNNRLRVAIDGDSTPREIILATGTALSGDDIARDLEEKISMLAAAGGPVVGDISYLNVMVYFKNNKFNIISGTISNTYTGTGKSSVKVYAGLTNDASVTLGFDMQCDSESLSSKSPSEATLTSGYIAPSGTTLAITSSGDFLAGQAYTITDGVNREYFVPSVVGAASMTITGLSNSYAAGSIVQRVFERDPESPIASDYKEIDDIVRFLVRAISNQVDFSI